MKLVFGFKVILLVPVILLMTACTSIPEGVTPVSNFNAERYLGTWFEIARLDHKFERGLEQITANYSMRDDGGLKVLNKGFNPSKGEWNEAEGKAYFVDDVNTGHLKVSFFGPFYASYVVAHVDEEYQYALVTGPDTDYLWILARSPNLEQSIVNKLIAKAKQLGFDTDALIFVKH